MADRALSGLRIIELGDFISAAYCAKLMADLGAEVIKIERPGVGDSARRHGPFPDDIPHPEKSGLFIYLNTNKLGVTLDVETRTGARVFRELIEDADFLVENNHPPTMRKLGLEFESLTAINPRLIMTSITPFGQEGPYSEYRGYAINSVSGSGMAHSTGEPDRSPLTSPLCQGNYQGGIHAAAACMAALFGRRMTGKGQRVDVAEMDCIGTMISGTGVIAYVYKGAWPTRVGHRLRGFYPYTVLPCKDGYVEVITTQDRHWHIFLDVLGNPEWAKDPRYQNRVKMSKYADEIDALLAPWLMSHTKQYIFDICRERHLPFQPVRNMDEVLDTEQLRVREFFVEVEVPGGGKVKVPGAPYKLSETPWELVRPAPELGEHNVMVYCERLGYSRQDLVKMAQASII